MVNFTSVIPGASDRNSVSDLISYSFSEDMPSLSMNCISSLSSEIAIWVMIGDLRLRYASSRILVSASSPISASMTIHHGNESFSVSNTGGVWVGVGTGVGVRSGFFGVSVSSGSTWGTSHPMLAGLAGSVIHSGASSSGSRIPSSSQSALVIHSGATSSPSRMVSSSQSGSVIHSGAGSSPSSRPSSSQSGSVMQASVTSSPSSRPSSSQSGSVMHSTVGSSLSRIPSSSQSGSSGHGSSLSRMKSLSRSGSLSKLVTLTRWLSTPENRASDSSTEIETITTGYWVLSMIGSSTPVTVTVCGVFQSEVVNVKVSVTIASPVSVDSSVSMTFERGSAVSTIVKVSVVPFSSTITKVLL